MEKENGWKCQETIMQIYVTDFMVRLKMCGQESSPLIGYM